ncbi:MAG: arylsulfatase [Bacteroidales bacterium]|jgi:arylsulfatase A-like enzyme|nr:arylsulfatase [Bacteroidales bacterium]
MKPATSLLLFASLAVSGCSNANKEKPLPNIVFILADDMGYGDLSCYGQKKFPTPNIDNLAHQGMLFTQHYTGCTVSAPSRSSLMTGLHTGHTPIRGNKGWEPEGQWPLPAESLTLPEMLKTKGYVTGAFGKWGLGYIDTGGDPNAQGIDEFFGYNCQSLAHNYYPYYLWHNHEKILLPENDSSKRSVYSADTIQKAAIDFIKSNRNKPFFLFYPTTIPHAELFAKEKYMDMFRGKFVPEKSFAGVDDGPSFRLGPYGSQPEAHAAFAAMITELDDYVGEILSELTQLGLENNTIVIFASDNGPHLEAGADPDYFNSNGELRGYKRDMYEGGIRTPFLVKWPGKIMAGTREDRMISSIDMGPSVLSLAGVPVPAHMQGIPFAGNQAGSPRDAVFAARDRVDESYDMIRSVRTNDFLYICNYYPNEPFPIWVPYLSKMPIYREMLRLDAEDKLTGAQKSWMSYSRPPEELYNVKADPFQVNNLIYDPELKPVLEDMRNRHKQWTHETGDMGHMNEPEMIEQMWPGGKQPVTDVPYFIINSPEEPASKNYREGGSYSSPMKLGFYCPTHGASIVYTFEEKNNPHWLLYNGPHHLKPGNYHIRVKAVRYGYRESEELKGIFAIR